MLSAVAEGLKDLKSRVVFVGGATMDCYLNNPEPAIARTTDDVDCVIEITQRNQLLDLEDHLRALGFSRPMADSGSPICRWIYKGIDVDVMPTDPNLLGFSNRWYKAGMSHAQKVGLPDGQEVFIFSLAYFMASKLEAFLGRGKGDYFGSRDIEDIIAVLDGNVDVDEALNQAPEDVRAYIKEQFERLSQDLYFIESLPGHLGPENRDARAERIRSLIRGQA